MHLTDLISYLSALSGMFSAYMMAASLFIKFIHILMGVRYKLCNVIV